MDLLPCPFCGGDPRVQETPGVYTSINCDACSVELQCTDDGCEERARKRWNTRAHRRPKQ